MNTKHHPHLLRLAAALLWALPASATVILLDNNFNGLTTGNYTGNAGTQFGAAANLGNATGTFTTTVQGSGGVDNSQYALGLLLSPNPNQNPAIRSRDTFNAATIGAVNFSTYFKYNPNTTSAGNAILMGFALPNATDGVNTFAATIDSITNSNDHRLLFGLERSASAANTYRFSGGGRLGSVVSIGDTATVTRLTVDNWYQLEFSLLFNHNSLTPADSTVTLSGMNLRDWGTNGVTGGSSVRSFTPSGPINPSFGNLINTSHTVYAYIASNGDRGATNFDNVLVSAIPEPGTLALMGLALGAMLLGRRRWRR